MFPSKLQKKLLERVDSNALRALESNHKLMDFSSNDYLGFSKSERVFNKIHEFLIGHNIKSNGSSGSRLLTGNHNLYQLVENMLCEFHNSEACLIYNSGYDANIGFFSCVPQRGDIILYDEYVHASIRDGMALSKAKAYKFRHNNLEHLNEMLKRVHNDNIYVVTESVFSMDGDIPNLSELTILCKKYDAFLVVDEAHAVGVFGKRGEGLIQHLNLQNDVFARVVTFGKALGSHGAAILGSIQLKNFLINFSRSFIYTTALPPHTLATINCSYNELVSSNGMEARRKLHQNITFFKKEVDRLLMMEFFIESSSAIQCIVIKGNERVKKIASQLQNKNFNVKPILSPTVPRNKERLRFCIHAFNKEQEISEVLEELSKLTKRCDQNT